jgi:hypothetical protein
MLPQGYKVGSVTPGFKPAPKPGSAPLANAAKKVGGGAQAAGAKTAGAAKVAGGAVGSGAKAAGKAVAGAAKGAAHTAAFTARHPIAGGIKAPAVNVANQYKKTFNDPAAKGAKDTMKANFQRSPVKATIKTVAGATGALAPLAALKGAAQPHKSLRDHNAMKAAAADKKDAKRMGGLVFTPKAPAPPGRPRS